MNLIFMRHGEATGNANGIIADTELVWSVLTREGELVARETAQNLPKNISKIYVSPFPRTIQTASIVKEQLPNVEAKIDNRIREIYHGVYSGGKNNEDLDHTREMQAAGDYFVRFGRIGENKFEIERRLCSFLKDVCKSNPSDSTILVVSHGSVTSFMKRILGLKSPHLKTGKAEVFEDVDFSKVFEHIKLLEEIEKQTNK